MAREPVPRRQLRVLSDRDRVSAARHAKSQMLDRRCHQLPMQPRLFVASRSFSSIAVAPADAALLARQMPTATNGRKAKCRLTKARQTQRYPSKARFQSFVPLRFAHSDRSHARRK